MKPLLIVGIDPGTTLAYAILDLEGNMIKVVSSKQLDLDSLTTEVFSFGKPLIVATDVNPVPRFVEKFASQTGSKIIQPGQSLKVVQKKEFTKEYNVVNDHERDALASAVFAFKKVRALLEKINIYVKKQGKGLLKEGIIRLVVSKDLSISDAVSILEKKEVKPEFKKPKMRTESIKVKFDEVKYLRGQNEGLRKRASYLEEEINRLELSFSRNFERKVQDVIGFRDKKISFLNKEIRDYKMEIEKLNQKVLSLNSLLPDIDKFLIVPKLKSFNFDDVKDAGLKDVIFVEDPSSFSEKALDFLKGKVTVVVHSKPVSKTVRSRFVFIDVKSLDAVIEDRFVLVGKSKFEREKNKVNILARVVEEYEKERG